MRNAASPIAPAEVAAVQACASRRPLQRSINALDNWFYRQRVREREAYLAKAQDIFELEYRMRQLERGITSLDSSARRR